jgi:hypothetical protein
MASLEVRTIEVQDAGVRSNLKQACEVSGKNYEQALGGCIARRKLPILEMIEKETGIPVIGVSMDRTRGPKSSQSHAWFQWQRGHRRDGIRWPDATIEFVGAGGAINRVYALEISLQTDVTKIGRSRDCSMSMAKASQIALTAAVLAGKPAYRNAAIKYWYLCPWAPIPRSLDEMLIPLQNMNGTDKVTLTWMIVDHGN